MMQVTSKNPRWVGLFGQDALRRRVRPMKQDSRIRRAVEIVGREAEGGRLLLARCRGQGFQRRPRCWLSPAGTGPTRPPWRPCSTALNGGAGSEFVTLIRREVPNLQAVIAGFVAAG